MIGLMYIINSSESDIKHKFKLFKVKSMMRPSTIDDLFILEITNGE